MSEGHERRAGGRRGRGPTVEGQQLTCLRRAAARRLLFSVSPSLSLPTSHLLPTQIFLPPTCSPPHPHSLALPVAFHSRPCHLHPPRPPALEDLTLYPPHPSAFYASPTLSIHLPLLSRNHSSLLPSPHSPYFSLSFTLPLLLFVTLSLSRPVSHSVSHTASVRSSAPAAATIHTGRRKVMLTRSPGRILRGVLRLQVKY